MYLLTKTVIFLKKDSAISAYGTFYHELTKLPFIDRNALISPPTQWNAFGERVRSE